MASLKSVYMGDIPIFLPIPLPFIKMIFRKIVFHGEIEKLRIQDVTIDIIQIK